MGDLCLPVLRFFVMSIAMNGIPNHDAFKDCSEFNAKKDCSFQTQKKHPGSKILKETGCFRNETMAWLFLSYLLIELD